MDMSGNVWEWLSDVFQSGQDIIDVSDLDVEDDDVPSYNMIIMKGGSWARPENDSNLSGMNVAMPDEDANDRGFRVAIAKM
jgi:formylglycine-generating enzyme required for sulfatase activity